MVPRRHRDSDVDGDESVYENRDNSQQIELDEVIEKLVKQKCETHAEQLDRERHNAWSFTPQTVSTYIAVIGIVLGAAWTFSDFRVTLNDISARQTNTTERINQLEKKSDQNDLELNQRLTSIDNNGTRQLIGEEATIKALKDQIETLKDAVDSVNGAIAQHNESMYDLYRKQHPGQALPTHHDIDLPLVPNVPRKRKTLDLIKPPGNNQFTDRAN